MRDEPGRPDQDPGPPLDGGPEEDLGPRRVHRPMHRVVAWVLLLALLLPATGSVGWVVVGWLLDFVNPF